MRTQAQASVAAYSCCASVRVSASQLERRWLLEIFFLKEEGIDFLQTLFFDAERGYVVLQFHPVAHARVFLVTTAQHGEIVFQRQADLEHVVLKELFQEVRQSEVIQTEQEAGVVSRDLQESHLVDGSLPEGRTCFSVHSHQYMGIEVINGLAGLGLGVDYEDATGKRDFG